MIFILCFYFWYKKMLKSSFNIWKAYWFAERYKEFTEYAPSFSKELDSKIRELNKIYKETKFIKHFLKLESDITRISEKFYDINRKDIIHVMWNKIKQDLVKQFSINRDDKFQSIDSIIQSHKQKIDVKARFRNIDDLNNREMIANNIKMNITEQTLCKKTEDKLCFQLEIIKDLYALNDDHQIAIDSYTQLIIDFRNIGINIDNIKIIKILLHIGVVYFKLKSKENLFYAEQIARYCWIKSKVFNNNKKQELYSGIFALFNGVHSSFKDIECSIEHKTNLQKSLQTETKPHKFCAYCEKISKRNQYCSLCGISCYCDRKCQKKHWRNGHRKQCLKLNEIFN